MKRSKFLEFGLIFAVLFCVQFNPKHASHPNNILSSLHAGIRLDSAKRLTKNAGWICDTDITYGPELTYLKFRSAYLAPIDNSFAGLLKFMSGKLVSLSLTENPTSFSMANAGAAQTLKDYKKIVILLGSIYGLPHDSGTSINPPINSDTHYSIDRMDTVHLTTWLDKKNFYSVQDDQTNGELRLTELFLEKD